jgi:hypothetical protein
MTEKEAGEIAHGLVQGFIGPDHRVMDMQSFYRALSQALQKAHQQGPAQMVGADASFHAN